ncbi:hypothetical protein [Demequina litorisediminis]|uniref:Uncharacterized protein n=1 Tax=Demequina litorisediminis TaxID=1849022 RepID=A0ABQ6IKD8_9MICO|nr:hypothetical protein [Demequina litorisediminis]GMA37177.1 hypothetical protein GCM10025876_33810 [Demequina litorisediminis]
MQRWLRPRASAPSSIPGAAGLAGAAAAVSAEPVAAQVASAPEADAVERPEPTPSPWAQVREQSGATATSAVSAPEAEAPAWGASQYTPRLELRDDAEQSDVAQAFGGEDDTQR